MSDVDFINGAYDIEPHTSVTKAFWYPPGKSDEYFDVSIMPVGSYSRDEKTVAPPAELRITAKRVECTDDGKFVIHLTIENHQGSRVRYTANHIRIPSH
jgi:hypothetical protein